MAEDERGGISSDYLLRKIYDEVGAIRERQLAYATKAELALVQAKIEDFVPKRDLDQRRQELEARVFKVEDGLAEIDRKISKLPTKEDLERGPVAGWIWPALSVMLALWGVFETAANHGVIPK